LRDLKIAPNLLDQVIALGVKSLNRRDLCALDG
jgi:hypothetical protein